MLVDQKTIVGDLYQGVDQVATARRGKPSILGIPGEHSVAGTKAVPLAAALPRSQSGQAT